MINKLTDFKKSIGNTPLAEIIYRYRGRKDRIFAKAEYYNLTGSVKDRMAYYTLEKAIEKGVFHPGDTIVEATSGNTGIAFCALGAYLGSPVVIYMPDWMSSERKKLISSFGAEIRPVSHEEGGFLGSIAMADELSARDGFFCPEQFRNSDNAEGQYESLGLEIVSNLEKLGLKADGFIAGVGTGGTVMGVGKALREVDGNCRIYPLEPAESPTLSTGGKKLGNHRIAGISDEFIPDLLDLSFCDEIIPVHDGDGILAAKELAKKGLAVGISSGANLIGAIMVKEKLGDDKVVVTVLPDDNKKYLSTDLLGTEPMKDEYITKDLEIERVIFHR